MDLKDIPDYILVEVIQRFVAGERPDDISERLRTAHGLDISRERIYRPLLGIAIERGYFQVLPPPNYDVGLRLAGSYGKSPDDIQVVDATGHLGRAQVCARAV